MKKHSEPFQLDIMDRLDREGKKQLNGWCSVAASQDIDILFTSITKESKLNGLYNKAKQETLQKIMFYKEKIHSLQFSSNILPQQKTTMTTTKEACTSLHCCLILMQILLIFSSIFINIKGFSGKIFKKCFHVFRHFSIAIGYMLLCFCTCHCTEKSKITMMWEKTENLTAQLSCGTDLNVQL